VKSWTLSLKGGAVFGVAVPNNPPVVHDGRLTVCHLFIDGKQLEDLCSIIRGYGARVEVHAEEQTQDQSDERQALLGISQGMENQVYPTGLCPECFWFNPQLESYCNFTDSPKETVRASLKHQEKAKTDLDACPLHGIDS